MIFNPDSDGEYNIGIGHKQMRKVCYLEMVHIFPIMYIHTYIYIYIVSLRGIVLRVADSEAMGRGLYSVHLWQSCTL